MTKSTIPPAVTAFKKKVTVVVGKAENLLKEANTLLQMSDEDIPCNNLSNKLDELLAHKAKMEGIELELYDVTIDDSEATPDEKITLQASMIKHVEDKFPLLFVQINETAERLIQRVENPEPVCPTRRDDETGQGLHNLFENNQGGRSPPPRRSRSPSPSSQHHRQPQPGFAGNQQGPNANHPGRDAEERMGRMEANIEWFRQAFEEMRKDRQRMEQRLNSLATPSVQGREGVCHISSVPTSDSIGRSMDQRNSPGSSNMMGGNQTLWNPTIPQPTGFRPYNMGNRDGYNTVSGFSYSNPMAVLQNQGIAREDIDTTIRMEQMKATLVTSALAAIKGFSGEEYDYPSFMAQFDNMVHNNVLIDVKVKQTMLLSLLPPTLVREHQTSDVSESSYFMIRNNLERQFNRQNTQLNSIADEIMTLVFPEDAKKLKSTLNLFSTMAYKLQAYGINPNDRLFLIGLVNRLPERVRYSAYKKLQKGGASLNDILNEVHNTIALQQGYKGKTPIQALGCDDNYVNQININTVSQQQQRRNVPRTSARRPRRDFVPPSKEKPCRYCDDKDHCAAECNVSLEKKREAVHKKVLCYNCLSEKHTVGECRSRFRCLHCQKLHFSGHCPSLKHRTNININYLAIEDLDDDEELEKQLFRGSGAETPEF